MKSSFVSALAVALVTVASTNTLHASFHLMQIEQVIGGVNGDTTAQAIQLRMRSPGQNLLLTGAPNAPARLVVRDAAGLNPVTLITFDSNVTNSNTGDTVLVTSSNFAADVSPGFLGALRTSTNADFTLTNLIPTSYLNAGKLTYEESTGTILWSLAWGGASYTGSTSGANGFNGAADPGKFGGPLPSSNLGALLYSGAANGTNSNDATDYAVTTGAATFTDNARSNFTVTGVPEPSGSIILLFSAFSGLLFRRRFVC